MVQWEALDALSHQLELCRLGPDTNVALLFHGTTTAARADLVRAAVARTGAVGVELRLMNDTPGGVNPVLNGAIAAADIVIAVDIDHLDDLDDGLRTGHHRLLHLSPVAPQSFRPHANLRLRVRALHAVVEGAESLVITDDHGTDLRIGATGAIVDFDHGLVDDEHRVARFPAGWVGVTPARATVNGQIVLMPGDANLATGQHIGSPVVLQLLDDQITAITGESSDADVLRALFEYRDDPAAYGIAEISVGMNPGATPSARFDPRLLEPALVRLLAGIVTVSFGQNLLADRPGPHPVTVALASRSVSVDGLPIVRNGSLDGDFAPDVYEF